MSGLKAVVSTCAASGGLVVAPYIALAGTQIDSLPAILTADPPELRTPEPLGLMLIPTLVSPVAEITGPVTPVAALAIVSSLTAEPVAVKLINSFPLVSKILVPILGEVKVLFVKVCVPARVTVPAGKV